MPAPRLAFLALASIALAAPPRAQQVRVTYLANEGVLVEAGGTRVLIDALFRDSMDPYARYPGDVQGKLETGQKPYDGIQLALATHFHLDHWDAGAVTRFLRSNPQALFASTEQGTAMIPSALRDRTRNLWPAGAEPSHLEAGGARVTAFPLKHGSTQNLGYRLELAGKSVAHLGDADPSEENFRRLTTARGVDVAMVPFWWLLDPKALAFLRTTWKPRNAVALHFGITDLDSLAEVQAAWPGVWAATKQFESREY